MTYKQGIKHFGSATKWAKTIGVSLAVIDNWRRRDRVSDAGQLKTEIATNGKLKARSGK